MIGDEKIVLTPRRIAIRDIRTASLGVSHSAVVTESGLVYCGGVGTHGELGVVLNESHSGWEKIEVADRQFEN
jgi:alpha-tubulin suppressor-like RCC1 family protein